VVAFTVGKGKGRGQWTLDSVPLYKPISSQKRSGMARVVKLSHSFTYYTRLFTNRMNHMPSPSQLHLLTPVGWKAGLVQASRW